MGAMYFPLLAFLFVPMITVSLALPLTDTTIQRRDVPDFVTQYGEHYSYYLLKTSL
jgi:hypothetical protein